MPPSHLLLECVNLGFHIDCLLGFLKAVAGFLEDRAQVWDSFPLLVEDAGRLIDVLKTGVIFIAQLAQLSALEEELPKLL